MPITLRSANAEEIFIIYQNTPEFSAHYQLQDIRDRLAQKPFSLLIAEIDGRPAGFKAGYALSETSFYSWLGGVLPAYRRCGVAQTLLTAQEQWARQQGYRLLSVKTRNGFKGMLLLLLRNDYQLIRLEARGEVADFRLLLEKRL